MMSEFYYTSLCYIFYIKTAYYYDTVTI